MKNHLTIAFNPDRVDDYGAWECYKWLDRDYRKILRKRIQSSEFDKKTATMLALEATCAEQATEILESMAYTAQEKDWTT